MSFFLTENDPLYTAVGAISSVFFLKVFLFMHGLGRGVKDLFKCTPYLPKVHKIKQLPKTPSLPLLDLGSVPVQLPLKGLTWTVGLHVIQTLHHLDDSYWTRLSVS